MSHVIPLHPAAAPRDRQLPRPAATRRRCRLLNIPAHCTASGAYGILVTAAGQGRWQITLTSSTRRNINNPPGHGGDIAYAFFLSEQQAVHLAYRLADAADPLGELSRARTLSHPPKRFAGTSA